MQRNRSVGWDVGRYFHYRLKYQYGNGIGMNLIHIVGRKNNGKTKLIVELIQEMRRRGFRVGTIKHSGHSHELDKPGKDSHRHRKAGGEPVAVVTADQIAVYLPLQKSDNPMDVLAPLFEKNDLVLVEGFIDGPGKKIEVWRREIGSRPIFHERADIKAVVSDDAVDTELPVWPRMDIRRVADGICRLAELHEPGITL